MGTLRQIRDDFFEEMLKRYEALTFDDALLRPGKSDVPPDETILDTRFSKKVTLKIPLVSAAMDTVSGAKMAIALACQGGIGVLPRNFSIEEQAREIARVKHHLHGLIKNPITVRPDQTVGEVLSLRERKGYAFHTFPVVDDRGALIGLLTRNDFDFYGLETKVGEAMTQVLLTGSENTDLKVARALMVDSKKKVVPLINTDGILTGMYVFSDVHRALSGETNQYNLDDRGMLRVAAAVGTLESERDRVSALVRERVDVIVIDTARGDSDAVFRMISHIKKTYGDAIDVVAGNISEGEAAKRLVDAGADGIKVGQGGGSICTTRMVAAIGCPQLTAIAECERAIRGSGIPVCGDGGIRYPSDISKALGAGADSVMIGGLFAGTDEAPGDFVYHNGVRCKSYRGMASAKAFQTSEASRQRYSANSKSTPEGVEALVPHRGALSEVLEKLLGGVRANMGYVGAHTIPQLQEKANFWRITPNGLTESKPHDVLVITDHPSENQW